MTFQKPYHLSLIGKACNILFPLQPAELLPRNPVGRPRIHPKAPQRPLAPPVTQSSMTPRIQIRPEQQLQRPIQIDEGPPAQRMKHSPPASPAVSGTLSFVS